MEKNALRRVCYALLALSAMYGCEQKFDLSTLPQPGTPTRDTAYVQISPLFGGFTEPQDIMIGNDQLLYVADTRANPGRIVMMNFGGTILSSRAMLHPRSIAQDTRLDLLVGGELVAANGDTVGAVFRIHLVSSSLDSAHRLDVARIDTVWRELANPDRRFPGVATLPDNSWLAVRSGPDNSSVIDPDARVLLFDDNDNFITSLPSLSTRTGSGITDINRPTAIASFQGVRDFVLSQSSEGVAYGAIWMIYQSTPEFEGWLPKYNPANPVDRFVDFIRPNRYVQPEAIAIDKSRRDVFIADASLDSVFKFSSRGTFKSESFGVVKTGGVMLRPTGLAFLNKILYVLDAQQGAIIRFILTTDVPR